MKLEEGTLVQGDGSSSHSAGSLAPPKLYVVRQGELQVISDIRAFRKAGYDQAAVQVIPEAELAKLPVAQAAPRMALGEEIVLDLDSFLGAGHYMTTYGVLRRSADGGHIDATTRTRTITMFGGFHGAVNIVYSDASGFPVGMSATQRFGVDGTWIGRSDRTDYWSDYLSVDWATRTTRITIFHFWDPDQLATIIQRDVDALKPIVQILQEIVKLGGSGKSSS